MRRPASRVHRTALIVAGLVVAGTACSALPAVASTPTASTPTASASASASASPAPSTPSTPAPATYLVDCSAKTNGDGVTTPWNSLAAIRQHGSFSPGQRILLKRGTTCRGALLPAGSGAPGKPIVLGAYGSTKLPKPTIAGGGTHSGSATLTLINQQYWTFQDLTITNHAPHASTIKTYRSGVYVYDSVGRLRGITVQRLTIKDVVSDPASSKASGARYFGGIIAMTSIKVRGVGFDGLTIADNTIDHVSRTGIFTVDFGYARGRSHDLHVRITGNRVSHTRGDGIVQVGSYAGRIDHNVAHHTGEIFPCKQCRNIRGPETANAAIWTAMSNGVRIDHNEVYATNRGGGDGEGLDADVHTRNAVIEDNYSHDNDGGGVLLCASTNATVRFNVLQNNTRGQIVFTCGRSHTVKISNNDIYLSGNRVTTRVVALSKGTGSTGISFTNNLVWAWGTAKYQWPGRVHAADNTFVGSHHSSEPTGPGTSHRTPGVRHPGRAKAGWKSLSAYRLTGHAVQRGVAIPKSVATDILGHRVNTKHPARGAFSS